MKNQRIAQYMSNLVLLKDSFTIATVSSGISLEQFGDGSILIYTSGGKVRSI